MAGNNHPKFAIWLAKLEAKAGRLYSDHKHLSVEALKDGIDTCNSTLEMLTEIADTHDVQIAPYLPTVKAISEQLCAIEQHIRTRSAPAWKRILLGIAGAVNFVSALIGLGALIPTQLLLGDSAKR